ncbi:hypothetical protein KYJ26_16995 [Bacillus sp. MCCB 382]|uniref:hypothetical protein n=1 Tax=Bacillus sp. MCCB 382 TaxID=2860197 RepID=UPI001C574798|nr:hypothetical protein [Bacillus sp. MCCB 382]
MKFDLEKAQELLDTGMSGRAVGRSLGLHHSAIFRAIQSGDLDDGYIPFDEDGDKRHLHQNFEWLHEEDRLEDILTELYEGRRVLLDDFLSEDFRSVGVYVRKEYGGISDYFREKGYTRMLSGVQKCCTVCSKNVSVKRFNKHASSIYGIESYCKKCSYERVRKYVLTSDSYREHLKIHAHNRRAKEKLLPFGYDENDLLDTLEVFGGCVLTGDADIHLDHVIPIAIGHGGTIKSNMIPLRSDLNMNKKKSNIFEWFSANKQRFNLSQEKFDTLIDYLAELNEMTREEYREYVYWCHANPRTVDQLREEDVS